MGITLVQVGHGRHEPPVNRFLHIHLRGIGVEYGRQLVTGLQEARPCGVACSLRLGKPLGKVQPVLARQVGHPGMFKAAMVENHVHHHLQPFLMCLVNQFPIVGIGTETRIHPIVVCGGIAVIGREAVLVVGRIVFQHGCEPQGRHAQLLEIVQVLSDAFQIPAMTQGGLCAVFLVGVHALHLRVVVVALCKAVGHEHIEHIGIRESLTVLALHLTFFQRIGHGGLLVAERESQGEHACFGTFHIQIHQQIVRRLQLHDGIDLGTPDAHLSLTDALAIDHQLQGMVFHIYIPVGGVDARNLHIVCRQLGEGFGLL